MAAQAIAPIVKGASHTVGEALTADLAVVRYSYLPKKRRNRVQRPIDVELHLNPAGLGVAAVGAGLTLWLMQLRVNPYLKGVEVGHWEWPDGTKASGQVIAGGTAPTRTRGHFETQSAYTYYLPAGKPYYDPSTKEWITPEEKAVYVPAWEKWVPDPPETATWVSEGTSYAKKYAIEQRRGFFMNDGGIVPDLTPPTAEELAKEYLGIWKKSIQDFKEWFGLP